MLERLMQRPVEASALLLFLMALAVVTSALLFEHVGGYLPCPLCLMERKPWYFAIPAGFLALAAARGGWPGLARIVLGAMAALFAANAVLAFYHAGVEWKWWAGPASCTGGSLAVDPTDFLGSLNNRVVRCDVAQLRIFGLSFSGYNFLLSSAASLIALAGLLMRPNPRH